MRVFVCFVFVAACCFVGVDARADNNVKTVTVEGIAVVGDEGVAAADVDARGKAVVSAVSLVTQPRSVVSPAPAPTIWQFFPRLGEEVARGRPELFEQTVWGPPQDGAPGTRKVKLTTRIDVDALQRTSCEWMREHHNTGVVVVVAETELDAPKLLVGEMEARLTHALQDSCFRTLSSPVDIARIDATSLPPETIAAIHEREPDARWLLVAAVHSDVKERADKSIGGMNQYRVRTALRAIDLASGVVDHDKAYEGEVIGISIEKAMAFGGDRVMSRILIGLLPDLGRRFAEDPLPPPPPPPPAPSKKKQKK